MCAVGLAADVENGDLFAAQFVDGKSDVIDFGYADYGENALIAHQLAAFPSMSHVVVATANIMTVMKWLFLSVGFLAMIVMILMILIKRTGR